MAWSIKLNEHAKKDLAKLDKPAAKRVFDFLHSRLAVLENPRGIGEALKGNRFGDYWKYRVGDYRIIADIRDKVITIEIIAIGNRREIYKRYRI